MDMYGNKGEKDHLWDMSEPEFLEYVIKFSAQKDLIILFKMISVNYDMSDEDKGTKLWWNGVPWVYCVRTGHSLNSYSTISWLAQLAQRLRPASLGVQWYFEKKRGQG